MKIHLKAAALAIATCPISLVAAYLIAAIFDYFVRYGWLFLTPGGSIGIRI